MRQCLMAASPPCTSRIQLAKIQTSDLDNLVALDSDPLVMKYINGGKPQPRSAYLGENGLLARMMANPDQAMGFFSARVDGAFAGWFHLRPSVFEAAVPELGYRLSQPYWGKGLATETSIALCHWAFDQLGADFVDACTVEGNAASMGVMLKCSMHYVNSLSHPRAPDILVRRYIVAKETFLANHPGPP